MISNTRHRRNSRQYRESALRKLNLQRQNTITELSELFEDLEPATQQPEELGVWSVTGYEAVTSRLLEFIDDADDELIYMTVDELLTDDHLDHLEAAEERGVDIYLAGLSDPVQAQLKERVPSAELFETLWAWSDAGAGSLLITDKRTALVSVLADYDTTDDIQETAIWGTGELNSLVVVLRAIFTWRLGTVNPDSVE